MYFVLCMCCIVFNKNILFLYFPLSHSIPNRKVKKELNDFNTHTHIATKATTTVENDPYFK